jgi:hypothetical protein
MIQIVTLISMCHGAGCGTIAVGNFQPYFTIMRKVLFGALFFVLTAATALHAQKTVNRWTLSPPINGTASSPRVIWNNSEKYWVVAWRQSGSSANLVCRIVSPKKGPGAVKTLVSGISSYSNNFDLLYDRQTQKYLVAYESTDGLKVQSFNQQLAKEGAVTLIESGVRDGNPRLIQSLEGSRALLFWFAPKEGVPAVSWKSRVLEIAGTAIQPARLLRTASTGMRFRSLDVSLNPKSGNLFASFVESNGVSNASILGFSLRPDGTLIRKTPSVFQSNGRGTESGARTAFSRTGFGMGIWSQAGSIQFRQLSPSGSFSSPASILLQAPSGAQVSTDVLLLPASNRFLVSFTQNGEVRAEVLNSNGSVEVSGFPVATSNTSIARNVLSFVDQEKGTVLTAWEDQSGANTFQVRAALSFIVGLETTLRGTIESEKTYSPPLKVHGTIYLGKYHIRTPNGKLFRAYITPETEFIGRRPRVSDFVEVHFEAGKSRVRGYIESIQVAQD